MQRELGLPVLAGVSRKSMIGAITGKPVEQRLAGSLAGALAAVAQGARIVRVHDVTETVDALHRSGKLPPFINLFNKREQHGT